MALSRIQLLVLSHMAIAAGCSNTAPATDAGTPKPGAAATSTPTTTGTAVPTVIASVSPAPSAARGTAALGEVCRRDEDCVSPLFCQLGFDGATFSKTGTCVKEPPVYKGRPLVVEGLAQVPAMQTDRAWTAAPAQAAPAQAAPAQAAPAQASPAQAAPAQAAPAQADVVPLDECTAASLAAWLRHSAAQEYASIAAFARTICELSALAAPASLIARTQQALADEIRHTEQCLAWAERLDGQPARPSRLAAATAAFAPLEELAAHLLVDVFRGGCIGETLAAHALAQRALVAPLDALAVTFEAMASDEARHAALAFDTVAWLGQQDATLRALVQGEVAAFERRATAAQRELLMPLLATLVRSLGGEASIAALVHGAPRHRASTT